ncbi:Endonuclease III [Elusimicrobium minutum Pei191]|uniref:Endonuclease III n=1 Tax=Elusimicrobium minutum (strain Pei191) TaxID=445932 RepID=B2KBM8_ELUMP|nr:endonuclease III [Elusimicrobium minutum]ACC97715.1 Endonuclease III [Elusimicrobium minutum Pei191]
MLLKKEKISKIVKILRKDYPDTKTALGYESAFQLLVAVILSAQCTDARVNMVTPVLFAKYPTPQKMAKANLEDIETIIKSTGFYHAKAKSIVTTAQILTEDFNGEVPDNMNDLLKLRGVARKTANVVLSDFFKKTEGVVVDTHVKRVSYRTGLTNNTAPVKVELDLMKKLPKQDWLWAGNAFVWHGRKVCDARKPKCSLCSITKICPKNGVKNSI